MNRLLVICGPTATGKTNLGIKLAKELEGEIVSADSRQVYRHMNIGTGKDLPVKAEFFFLKVGPYYAKAEVRFQKVQPFEDRLGYYLFGRIPIWLLDVVEPNYQFSVADYVQCTSTVIKNIWRRGKLPIIVGGTGFYIKGLVDGIETLGVRPDWELREKFRNLEIGKLRERLQELDPSRLERMSKSDRQNPRRLVRAIEIALKIKNEKLKMKNDNVKLKIDEVLLIGLKAPNEILYQRIDRRVNERVKQGVEKEIEGLLKKGYGWENSALGTTLGYQEWQPFFKGKMAKEEVIQRWKFNEHSYARRQMTWFKKDSRIRWFDITKQGWKKEVVLVVRQWYNSYSDDAEN